MTIYWATKIIELHCGSSLSGGCIFIYSGDNKKGLFRTGTVQSLMVPSWSQDWAFGVRQVKPLLPAWHSSWVGFWRLSFACAFQHGLDLKEHHMHHMLNTVCSDNAVQIYHILQHLISIPDSRCLHVGYFCYHYPTHTLIYILIWVVPLASVLITCVTKIGCAPYICVTIIGCT